MKKDILLICLNFNETNKPFAKTLIRIINGKLHNLCPFTNKH